MLYTDNVNGAIGVSFGIRDNRGRSVDLAGGYD